MSADLIRRFYSAFSDMDAAAMNSCYHPDVQFSDPVFGKLDSDEVKAMWRMLVHRGKPDLKIFLTKIDESETFVQANWEAKYVFSKTNRQVHNKIEARFEFQDGLIIRHTDRFDLYTWMKMAFGWKGALLGRTHWFKSKLKNAAIQGLYKWMEKERLKK